MLTTVYFIFLT